MPIRVIFQYPVTYVLTKVVMVLHGLCNIIGDSVLLLDTKMELMERVLYCDIIGDAVYDIIGGDCAVLCSIIYTCCTIW